MARVLKWQEKLVLACAALLFSVTSGLGLGPRDAARTNRSSTSRVVTVMGRKSAAGIELMTQRPYVRLVRASFAPISLPLAMGAYVAMADAATAAPAAEAASSCGTGTGGGGGTTGGDCYTVYCSGSFQGRGGHGHTCHTCGYGTCGVCC